MNLTKGFVFVELLVVICIIMLLAGISLASFRFFQNKMGLDETADQLVNVLRLAQNKTLASEGQTSYGVHFAANNFILFAGSSYDPASLSNQQYNLAKELEIFNINLAGSGSDVIFSRLTGRTSQFGQISIRLAADPAQSRDIYISSAGQIGFVAQSLSADTRQKDSRHVHFNYSRIIDFNAEKIILLFDNPPNLPTTQEIIIKDNLDANGQIGWERTILVGGQNQQIIIRTHQVNNPLTVFSIIRDRRFNNKALSVSLSGEPGYGLIDYTDNGEVSAGSSVWVSGLAEQ
ncbi:MAG: hypothetical protein UT31_C0002G0017 [Parcubacteria group bacterium GW2011_GWF2_39_13b]|nr:MAG: hypothetical protein UT31_C0002G0017 [Parcubacteria group bacterium GW2011_GWF2_39_13b]